MRASSLRKVCNMLEGKKFDPVGQLLRLGQLRNHFQVFDTPANGNPHLVGIDNARELNPLYLALFGFDQQVIILGE